MVYRVSKSPVHPTPEDPVLDIAQCGREDFRFLQRVGYRPKVVRMFLREVNSDDLWGVWAVVVRSRRPTRGMRPSEVGGLGGPFGWVIAFFAELERVGQSQIHNQK